MNDRLASGPMLAALAASIPVTSSLHAAPLSPPIGSTSRAAISISVSVRPRLALASDPWDTTSVASRSGESFCLRSTSPSLRFTVALEPATLASGPSETIRRPPEVLTAKSGFVCAAGAREAFGPASAGGDRRALLLLVAPD
jgi:hypothetical protein